MVNLFNFEYNYGHNKELMEACKPLKEYSWFVDKIRKEKKRANNLEEAIDIAISELPEDSLIKPFLIANKAEVKRMCITEYNEERTLAELKQDAREDGIAEGIKRGLAEGLEKGLEKGKIETALNLLSLGVISKEDIAKATGFTLERIKELAGQGNLAAT